MTEKGFSNCKTLIFDSRINFYQLLQFLQLARMKRVIRPRWRQNYDWNYRKLGYVAITVDIKIMNMNQKSIKISENKILFVGLYLSIIYD